MEALKNLLNVALVHEAAALLQARSTQFDGERFATLASHGLDTLELKARALHICSALEATLPADFSAAAALLEAALAPATADDTVSPAAGLGQGLRGWILWPVGEYIARHGQSSPARGLAALHALTQRFTAEYAIRPFIVQHPELAFATLARWRHDKSAHVRRLVSEGSRPRLPWGFQLKALIADPSPTRPLLLTLQDDPNPYVRRSVANHLNDIAKDHPGLVATWLEDHLPEASTHRRALLKHASRTLVKQGHPQVLQAWGLGAPLRGTAVLTVSPPQVAVGGELQLQLRLQSTAQHSLHPQRLAVDYTVHHVKADGRSSPKVFKGWTLELPVQGEVTLVKRHSMRLITTRRYHPGHHAVDVQINGKMVAQGHFVLTAPARH